MKTLKIGLYLFMVVSILVGCTRIAKKENGNENQKKTETGKVLDNMTANADQSVTYSVYLPKKYNDSTAYPVIIAFDPQGSGNLPVAMYKDLAEKYGYILVGSNNSRNGLDANAVMNAITKMITEVKQRFSVDSTRMYTLGFSGGARVAVIAGFNPGGIISVTGSGAGFPNTGAAFPYPFDYLGIAGTYDFNMHELLMLDDYLDQAQIHHGLLLFNGIHEWPPFDVMEKSFQWNDFTAMRHKKLNKNDQEISGYKRMQDSLISVMRNGKDFIGLRRELRNAINFLDQLADVELYRTELAALEKSPGYAKALAALKKEQEAELSAQHDIQENFFSKDTTWWTKKLADWEKTISMGKNDSKELMTRRLKSYLSLVCYMNYTKAMGAGEQEAANHAMWIYDKVDPEHAAQTKNGK